MREILFRGKRIDNDEWVHGDLVHVENKSYISYYYESPLSTFINEQIEYVDMSMVGVAPFIEVDPTTIGQYTGLTDKNGKKIFEGDIIHVNYTISAPVGTGPLLRIVKHSIDYKSVVAFENCRFCLKKQNGEIFEMHLVPGEVEVIGNIHDNPELLEAYK